MATPGKVLVVLVLLFVPIWMILAAGVAELNKSGGQQISTLKSQVEKLEKDVVDAQREIVGLKDRIALEQEAMTEQLAVYRSRQTDLQKARSETVEIATRDKLQVDTMLAAGLDAPHSCREGHCGSCVATVLSGEVAMPATDLLDDSDLAAGLILGCQARPVSDDVHIEF